MFNLKQRLSRKKTVAAVPAGERVYAIGDIHGRLDLFDRLIAMIEDDDRQREPGRTTIILLGDLIDRGPESAQVIDRAIQLTDEKPDVRWLVGNHEEVFTKAIEGDLAALRFFNRIGGRTTIASYGVSDAEYERSNYDELMALLVSRVPDAHRAFVATGEDMIVIGDYAFVHAGIRPEVALADQTAADLRWIREDFLSFRGAMEKTIVHGHTIFDKVTIAPYRIGLDTGAYASGVLTAMGFAGTDRWTLQTTP